MAAVAERLEPHAELYQLVAHLLGPGASPKQVEATARRAVGAARAGGQGSARLPMLQSGVAAARLELSRSGKGLAAAVDQAFDRARGRAGAERLRLLFAWRCLFLLPVDLRFVYVLHDLERRRGREAAALLGISEPTMWQRLRRARQAMLKGVERLDGEDIL